MNKTIKHIGFLVCFMVCLMPLLAQNQVDSVSHHLPMEIKHSPKKAVILALTLPGAGQIYNKKYWKLPIVYGGLAASSFYIAYNHNKFKGFETALSIRRNGGDDEYKDIYSSESALETNMLNFRNERDRAILITAGIYLLQVIDAYVDAHLYDFDISDDLTMNIQPAFNYDIQTQSLQSGISLNLSLR